MSTHPRARRHAPVLAMAVVAGLAAAPVVAQATTAPSVNDPTRASLNQSKPFFTWTNGPGGEFVHGIQIRTGPTTDATGRLTGGFAANLPRTGSLRPSQRAARAVDGLIAGTYYWNARYQDPALGDFEFFHTPVRRFVIRPTLRSVRILSFRTGSAVFSGRIYVSLIGRLSTNVGGFKMVCRLFNGRRLLSTQRVEYTSLNPVKVSPMGCLRLTIPQGLRGERLRATVNVTAGGRSQTATRFFVAR